MINNFEEGGERHYFSQPNQKPNKSEYKHQMEQLLSEFPKLGVYLVKQTKFLEKEKLLQNLRIRFKELDNESMRIDEDEVQTNKTQNQKEGLRVGKMHVCELEKETEKELKEIGRELDALSVSIIDEISEFMKLKNKLEEEEEN